MSDTKLTIEITETDGEWHYLLVQNDQTGRLNIAGGSASTPMMAFALAYEHQINVLEMQKRRA